MPALLIKMLFLKTQFWKRAKIKSEKSYLIPISKSFYVMNKKTHTNKYNTELSKISNNSISKSKCVCLTCILKSSFNFQFPKDALRTNT